MNCITSKSNGLLLSCPNCYCSLDRQLLTMAINVFSENISTLFGSEVRRVLALGLGGTRICISLYRLFFFSRLSASHSCQHSPTPIHRIYTVHRFSPARLQQRHHGQRHGINLWPKPSRRLRSCIRPRHLIRCPSWLFPKRAYI